MLLTWSYTEILNYALPSLAASFFSLTSSYLALVPAVLTATLDCEISPPGNYSCFMSVELGNFCCVMKTGSYQVKNSRGKNCFGHLIYFCKQGTVRYNKNDKNNDIK